MATVTGLTAARMAEIEGASVVDGSVQGDNLILTKHNGSTIDAGSVRGPQGTQGPKGDPGTAGEKITTGMLADFPKSPVPAGWLECDGSVKNIVDYPALGAYLGNTFGGDGTTTFGLPAYNGRVRVGRDASQVEFDTVGEAAGEKTHVLTVGELAAHGHNDTLAVPNHSHTMAHTHSIAHTHPQPAGFQYVQKLFGGELQVPAAGAGFHGIQDVSAASPATSGGSSAGSTAAAAITLSGGVSSNGSNTPHNNLQPYRVVITAIKT